MNAYVPKPAQSRGPLGDLARRLAHPERDVLATLEPAIGRTLAIRVIRAATHARIRNVGSPIGRSRTASVHFEEAPIRDRNSRVVRRIATVFTTICSWIGPNRRTGHGKQGHRLRVNVLARAAGVSVREVERYLGLLRTARILKDWQPPQSSGAPKGRSGYCYALYELVGEIPRQLLALLRRFHGSWWGGNAVATAAKKRGDELDGASIAEILRNTGPPTAT